MNTPKIAILTALITCASFNRARAATNTALDCLRASAQSGGLSGCLYESGKGDSEAVSAAGTAPAGTAPSLGVASLDAGENKRSNIVPTPMGYTSAQEGTQTPISAGELGNVMEASVGLVLMLIGGAIIPEGVALGLGGAVVLTAPALVGAGILLGGAAIATDAFLRLSTGKGLPERVYDSYMR